MPGSGYDEGSGAAGSGIHDVLRIPGHISIFAAAGTAVTPVFPSDRQMFPVFYYLHLAQPVPNARGTMTNRALIVDRHELEAVGEEARGAAILLMSGTSDRVVYTDVPNTVSNGAIAKDTLFVVTRPDDISVFADAFAEQDPDRQLLEHMTAVGVTATVAVPIATHETAISMCGGGPNPMAQAFGGSAFGPRNPPPIDFLAAPGASGPGPGAAASGIFAGRSKTAKKTGLALLIAGAAALTIGVVGWGISKLLESRFVASRKAVVTSSFTGELPEGLLRRMYAIELMRVLRTNGDVTSVSSGNERVSIDINNDDGMLRERLLAIAREPISAAEQAAISEWKENNTVTVLISGQAAAKVAAGEPPESQADAESIGVLGCAVGLGATALAGYAFGWKGAAVALVASGALLMLMRAG